MEGASQSSSTLIESTENHSNPRNENPLIAPINPNEGLSRFRHTINKFLIGFGIQGDVDTNHEVIPGWPPIQVIQAKSPFKECTPEAILSLANLSEIMNPESKTQQGVWFYHRASGGPGLLNMGHGIDQTFAPTPTYYSVPSETDRWVNPYQAPGVFLDGKKLPPVAGSILTAAKALLKQPPKEGTLRVQNLQNTSEVEFAFQTILANLIINGKLDISTPEKLNASLKMRQELFLNLYHDMLSSYIPSISEAELYGLDSQIKDIRTHLYDPLTKRKGSPMNSLMVGAPGVGKSATARMFTHDSTLPVITIPMSIELFTNPDPDKSFERVIMPSLQRIREVSGLPVVVSIDDIEAVLETSIHRSDGHDQHGIDTQKRSTALNLLERMMDTYKIFVLGSLNHPDVEAAFLRRFNPVLYPLPSEEQRVHMLQGILPKIGLSDQESQELTFQIAQTTKGFNYSGLALIPDYLRNIARGKDLQTLTSDEYLLLLSEAIEKAGQRTPKIQLEEFNMRAAELVGKKKEPLGFRPKDRYGK